MPLAITDDHRALGDVVRAFSAANNLRASARAALDDNGDGTALSELWGKLAAQGWLGLHIPEEYGGSGYSLAETAVVADELGYSLSPAPFLPSVTVSAALVAAGSDAQRKSYLEGLADGSLIAGIALTGSVTRSAAGTLSGEAVGLLGGPNATLLLVKIGEDLAILERSQAGIVLSEGAPLDPALATGAVTLTDVAVSDELIVTGGAAAALRALRALAAAEAAGGARASLDMALEYAKVREQFGQIIGAFQAVKHHLSDMLIKTELATAVAWDAARAADGEQGELAAAAAAAEAFEDYQWNAQKNIQLLGGIGFTWEHDAHLFLRRAVSLRNLLAGAGSAEEDLYALAAAGVRRSYGVDLPPEAEAYRVPARELLATYQATPEADRRRLLADSGYLVPHWPAPFGRGAGPVEQLVIEEELAAVDHPDLGITGWVLLTLTQTGTPEQVERWVPPTLAGEHIWCQLFSEPGAGSDAAAVRTRGEKVEGGWKINGQKVWTSGAHKCSRGLATIRTDFDAPKHKGITTVVIDMHAPGVEIRPLRQISGGAEFNEVFFDDVFVPDADVVGEVNDGWRVARTTLGNERVSIGGGLPGRFTASKLLPLIAKYAPEDEAVRLAAARLIAEEQALGLVNLRQVARAVAGSGPGPEGNVTKLAGAEHTQRLSELAIQVVGVAVLSGAEPEIARNYLGGRSSTIAGGTSEITRNVIAERILGLPRQPAK
ncbi:MAG: putative acyl-CoA dehydrogenase [Frankiales bacterium]|nr:putative acyl-CoA dehydrogenase [Frankiales bacterium]